MAFPVALLAWTHWFSRLGRMPLGARQFFPRIILGVLLPLTCWTFLLAVLARLSAKDVQSDPAEIGGYWLLGVAWIGAAQWLFGMLGVSMRDDVLERRDAVAAYVIAGQLLAITCCFAGANIGDGPGAEVVVFCAVLSSASLLLFWLVLDRVAAVSDTVTIDRDLPTGIRVGGWFAASGIVLGAGVAGDWHSFSSTLFDFATYAFPAFVLAGFVAIFERFARNQPKNTLAASTLFSATVSLGYIGLAALYVYERGLR